MTAITKLNTLDLTQSGDTAYSGVNKTDENVDDLYEHLVAKTIGQYSSSLNTAVTNIGSTPGTLLIDESVSLTANATVPSTLHLVFTQDGQITLGTYTLTLNGPITAPVSKIFNENSTGAVTFGNGYIDKVLPEWWGAVADNSTNCTAGFQSAENSISTGKIALQDGTYKTTDTVTVSNHRVGFEGVGPKASHVNFVPTSGGKSAFKFQLSTAAEIAQNFMKDMSIGSTDTTLEKYGLEFVDVTEFRLKNVAINPLNGASSVGILVKGRDLSSMIELEISADIPIQVSKNPNTTTADMTNFNFHDTYFIATGTNPHMLIDTNCYVVNLTIDGSNTWAAGKYGIYLSDANTSTAMYNWVIRGLIIEQVTETGGFCFYLDPNTELQNITFQNVYLGPSGQVQAGGWYMRNCRNIVIDNCTYDATALPIDADNTVYPLEIRNTYINDSANALSTSTLIPYKYLTSSSGKVNYALYLDSSSSNIGTLTANAGIASVGLYDTWKTANTQATTYTAFTNGYPGKKVRILIQDAYTTVDFTGTNLKGNTGADWSPSSGDWMEGVTLDGTTWYFAVHDCTA